MGVGVSQADIDPPTLTEGGTASRSWAERIIEGLIRLCGISAILIITLIFLFLIREGIGAFKTLTIWEFLGSRWYPVEDMFGIMPLAGRFGPGNSRGHCHRRPFRAGYGHFPG